MARWPRPPREPVEPWMTVGYVGRSWDPDPRLIDAAAELPSLGVAGRSLTLREVAMGRGVPVEVVVSGVEAALARLHGHRRGPGVGAEAPVLTAWLLALGST